MRLCHLFAALLFAFPAACLFADSHAYVVASGISYATPGSIIPFNIPDEAFGAAVFVPEDLIGVPPGSRQIWQAAGSRTASLTVPGP
jgi:hypothetical protein